MPNATPLPCLEIGSSRKEAELCVILMHGLGADGHDFAEVAMMLTEAAKPDRWRFILPHAGTLPVTINMGMPMPAWYDILDLSHPRSVDWETVAKSTRQIEDLLVAETAEKIVLAGFSQGGAMALHVGLQNQERIAGIASMSGYLLESKDHPVPSPHDSFPIGIFHGSDDEVVPFSAAELSREALESAGYTPEFYRYPGLAHSVSQDEIRDFFRWLREQGSPFAT
ncbi:MAG: alpha/beta hydrolase [Verrucomicrobiales bacterium]